MKKLLPAVVCLMIVATGFTLTTGISTASPAAAGPVVTAKGPCGTTPVGSTSYTHVIWIWMENHSYPTIIGSPQAPYINKLASSCGLATNYHNITHLSLPNYIGATSGLSVLDLQKFAFDCAPSSICSTSSPSVFGQGESWKAYEDSMPANCNPSDFRNYAVRHNPPVYYTTLAGCSTHDVPYTQFKTDLFSNALPAFSFITPNIIHDMHNGTVAQGNYWLSQNLRPIFRSSAYKSGSVAVFITWDEGEGGVGVPGEDCTTNTLDISCHVATIVASPSTIPGTQSSVLFNHYSLLRTAEELLGLPLLGNAGSATSMKSAFGL
jgi:phosphatidylinositol-3-phosphatase